MSDAIVRERGSLRTGVVGDDVETRALPTAMLLNDADEVDGGGRGGRVAAASSEEAERRTQ